MKSYDNFTLGKIIFLSLYLILVGMYFTTLILYIILRKKLKLTEAFKINRKDYLFKERLLSVFFMFETLFIPLTGMLIFVQIIYSDNQYKYIYDLFLICLVSFPYEIFKWLNEEYLKSHEKIHFKYFIEKYKGIPRKISIDNNYRAMLATIMAFYSSIAIIEGYILALIPLEYCSSMVFFSIVAVCSVLQLLIWYYNTIEQKRKITFYILSIINELLTLISITSLCALTYKSFPRENFGLSILFIKGLLIIIYIGKNFFFNKNISNEKLKLFDFIFTSLNNSNTKVAVINICASLLFYIISLFN